MYPYRPGTPALRPTAPDSFHFGILFCAEFFGFRFDGYHFQLELFVVNLVGDLP
jgi:hypothetical protein